ncbi:MAG: hypothetical protein RIQ31_210 [Actinomycetota bacterium]
MRKILTLVVASTVLLTALTTPAQAATPKAGAACAKAGITQVVKAGTKSTKFTCVKSGGKTFWNKGVVTIAKPAPKPIASGEPYPSTPTPSPTPSADPINNTAEAAYRASGWAKPTSSAAIAAAATKSFAEYTATKRQDATVNVVAQAGTPQYWIDWIKQGVTLIATTFEYPKLTGPYTGFVAKDVDWLKVEFAKVYGQRAADDRAGSFEGAPARGGSDTGVWNLAFIEKENLIANDNVGMKQTPAHEFFHSVQERAVGSCVPCGTPQWFWEGPAVFVGTQGSNQLGFNKYTDARQWMLDRTKHPGTVKLKLEEVTLNDGSMDPYGIGAIATEFLVANVGMAKFVNVYAQIGTGKSFKDAFKAATGVALSDFYLMFEDSRAVLGAPRG